MLDEIFAPYLPAIVIIITIGINLLLLFTHAPWWSYLIANVILVAILGIMDLTMEAEFNIFQLVIDGIFDIIVGLWEALMNILFGWWPSGCAGS